MTTPNKPNDDRHQPNGTSDRGASTPLPQRSRPAPSEEARSEAPSVVAERTVPEGDEHEELSEPVVTSSTKTAASSSSPDTGSSSALPQREPQTNLNRPGHSPVMGRTAGLNSGATNARTTADLAAKAARKEAAMVKSVGIDGPTRSIARPELIKDLPDLSELRHPLPSTPPVPMPMAPIPEPQHHSAPMPQVPVAPVSPAATAAVARSAATGEPLRATVQVRHIDPWSTLKVSLVISVAMFFVWMLAVGFLYIVLSGMGVWDRMSSFFSEAGDTGASSLIDAGAVFGYAAVVGLINVVLLTALSTVGVFIYNQCTDLVGGVQVTLADPD